jgi:hypothetical protein
MTGVRIDGLVTEADAKLHGQIAAVFLQALLVAGVQAEHAIPLTSGYLHFWMISHQQVTANRAGQKRMRAWWDADVALRASLAPTPEGMRCE